MILKVIARQTDRQTNRQTPLRGWSKRGGVCSRERKPDGAEAVQVLKFTEAAGMSSILR